MNLSAGIAVVHGSPDGWRFLLLRAYSNWDFPKGMVAPDESPIHAAIREVAEETGLTHLAFDWGDEHIDTGPYARGKIARYYLARAASTKPRIVNHSPTAPAARTTLANTAKIIMPAGEPSVW